MVNVYEMKIAVINLINIITKDMVYHISLQLFLGYTLLAIACTSPLCDELVNQIKYLVEEAKMDCQTLDSSNNTVVSCL